MAGLAAVTTRIKLFATVPTLTIPPAIAARMALDHRFDLQRAVRAEPDHRLAEGRNMPRWACGRATSTSATATTTPPNMSRSCASCGKPGASDLKGEFFTMNDCRLSPRPQADMKIICAGQSDAGLEFTAQYADYNFCFAKGINTPLAFADTVARMQSMRRRDRPQRRRLRPVMVITGETDAEAEAKWELYKEGADHEALAWLVEQATADKNPTGDSNVRHAIDPKSAVNINMGTLVGSHAKVARMLDEVATIPGLAGVLLTFDDFVSGTEIFGERIQPLMQCRRTSRRSRRPPHDPARQLLPAPTIRRRATCRRGPSRSCSARPRRR